MIVSLFIITAILTISSRIPKNYRQNWSVSSFSPYKFNKFLIICIIDSLAAGDVFRIPPHNKIKVHTFTVDPQL